MKIRILTRLFAAIVLASASLLTLSAPRAYAATNTWTGSANDGQWSTAGNWSAGVPNNGDDLVFNNSSYGLGGITDNIPGLNVNSITFTSDNATPANIDLAEDLTVNNAITQAPSVTSSVNTIASSSGAQVLTLGGNVTVTTTAGLSLGSANDGIDLNSNNLSFVTDNSFSGNNTVTVNASITGAGTVNYNSAKTDYKLYGENTYSGTTNVTASRLPVGNVDSTNAFGTSTVNVLSGAAIIFRQNASVTISNPIVVTGGASLNTSIVFGNTGAIARTITIPDISLLGNTRFQNTASPVSRLTINLAGIKANGHCIEYLSNATSNLHSGKVAGFNNAPASCTADANVGAPNTGIATVTGNPTITLLASVVAAGALLILARHVKLGSTK